MEDLCESNRQLNGESNIRQDKTVFQPDNICDKVNDIKIIKDKRKGFLRRKVSNNSWSLYESRCEDLRKNFDNVPDSEKLICDVQCALHRDILFHGRLYICLYGFYFQANVFKKEIQIIIKWDDVLRIKRGKTAKFIPNAIFIWTYTEQISFSSFSSRDKTFLLMQKLWQCALKNIEFPVLEINLWIQYYYGDPPSCDGSKVMNSQEQKAFRNRLQNQLKLLQQRASEEPLYSSNDKDEDRGGSEESGRSKGPNLLNVPSSFDFPIPKQDFEISGSTDVFHSGEERASSLKSNLSVDIKKLRKNSFFPLKKAHSRSFEDLESHSHKDDNKKISGKAVQKEAKDEKRRSLQPSQEMPDFVSDESGQDSDTTSKCCGHLHLPILVLDETLDLSAENVFQLCFSDSKLYRDFVNTKKTFVCQCGGHEELPELLLDEFYQLPVNYLFKIIFHKNHFWSELLKLRKAKNVVLTPWTTETGGSGARVRNITYTLSLDYPFSPKHSITTEKQVLHADSSPGEFYLVDTECVNNGLPYGEDFYIANRYCISKISEEKCRIRITSQIKYKKNVWGLVKAFIEKNATAGIVETFSIMGHLLRQEASQGDQTQTKLTADDSLRNELLRRKPHDKFYGNNEDYASSDENPSLPIFSIGKALTPTLSQTPVIMRKFASSIKRKHDQRWISNLTFAQAVKIVTALAMLLCIFNVFLFFKVHTLEHMTSQFEAQLERTAETKGSNNYLHSLASRLDRGGSIEQWKDAMRSLLVVMEEVAQSVSQLEQMIAPNLNNAEE